MQSRQDARRALGWATGLCFVLAAPAAFAEIHKCVDARTGSVAFSDLPCRNSEAQTALGVPRAGTRPTPAVFTASERPVVRPLQWGASPQAVLATATVAIRQMAETGEGCQSTLLQRAAPGETPIDCRAFFAQLSTWRAPVVLELAKLSIDKDFATPEQTAKLASLVETLGKALATGPKALSAMGRATREVIDHYSYEVATRELLKVVSRMAPYRGRASQGQGL